jgi:diaminopimelate epimerase
VKVRGGDLIVNYPGDTVYLTGSAELLYQGEIEV